MDEHITIPGGVFIVFEGPDGPGKSTQTKLLVRTLRDRGYLVVLTREPGGTRIGEQIRDVLHDEENTNMAKLTELLLFSASRRQHIVEIIAPALALGAIVTCDRFWLSTVAYQCFGRGIPIEEVLPLLRMTCGAFFRPDLVLHLDIDPQTGLDRKWAALEAGEPGAEITRLDAEQLDFHAKTRRGYLEMANWGPEFFGQLVTLDATVSIEKLHEQILSVVLPFLKKIIIGGGIQRDFAKI